MGNVQLTFDRNGYLSPYDIVSIEWEVFVSYFGNNPYRKHILTAYESFLAILGELLPVNHRQWVDGSFISQNQEPGDIDVIVFVPHTHFSSIAGELRQLKNNVAGLVDCYFVETFPPDHPKHEIGRADELDWYHFLRTDRRKRSKGSLELWFDYGNK
ncbi:DUF6932 family protein [Spirosoma jeollabukense]